MSLREGVPMHRRPTPQPTHIVPKQSTHHFTPHSTHGKVRSVSTTVNTNSTRSHSTSPKNTQNKSPHGYHSKSCNAHQKHKKTAVTPRIPSLRSIFTHTSHHVHHLTPNSSSIQTDIVGMPSSSSSSQTKHKTTLKTLRTTPHIASSPSTRSYTPSYLELLDTSPSFQQTVRDLASTIYSSTVSTLSSQITYIKHTLPPVNPYNRVKAHHPSSRWKTSSSSLSSSSSSTSTSSQAIANIFKPSFILLNAKPASRPFRKVKTATRATLEEQEQAFKQAEEERLRRLEEIKRKDMDKTLTREAEMMYLRYKASEEAKNESFGLNREAQLKHLQMLQEQEDLKQKKLIPRIKKFLKDDPNKKKEPGTFMGIDLRFIALLIAFILISIGVYRKSQYISWIEESRQEWKRKKDLQRALANVPSQADIGSDVFYEISTDTSEMVEDGPSLLSDIRTRSTSTSTSTTTASASASDASSGDNTGDDGDVESNDRASRTASTDQIGDSPTITVHPKHHQMPGFRGHHPHDDVSSSSLTTAERDYESLSSSPHAIASDKESVSIAGKVASGLALFGSYAKYIAPEEYAMKLVNLAYSGLQGDQTDVPSMDSDEPEQQESQQPTRRSFEPIEPSINFIDAIQPISKKA